jgi:hypothetical protein
MLHKPDYLVGGMILIYKPQDNLAGTDSLYRSSILKKETWFFLLV